MTREQAVLLREWQLHFKRIAGTDELPTSQLNAAHANAMAGVPVPRPDDRERCAFIRNSGQRCGQVEGSTIHDVKSPVEEIRRTAHPFTPVAAFVVPKAPAWAANPVSRFVVRRVLGPKGLAAVAIGVGAYAGLCQVEVLPSSLCLHHKPVTALLESIGAYDPTKAAPAIEGDRG